MSEVIESFIRRHQGTSEEAAFAGFLEEERIKAWVGSDEGRRERLRREFGRVWATMHAATGRSGPSGPSQMVQERPVRVDLHPAPAAPAAPVAPARPAAPRAPLPAPRAVEPHPVTSAGARKLHVLCASCQRHDVWLEGGVISCRRCGHVYDDMLQLVRVKPVGPFEFIFGEGWAGAATAVGIALAFIALYGVLRWV